MTRVRQPLPEHGSAHRDRVRLEWLLGALAAGPAGWILQLVIGYSVASHACRPHDAPRLNAPIGGWDGERIGLLVLNLACLALVLAGGAIAFKAWRWTQREKVRAGTLDTAQGRTRFLAVCGILVAGGFALATLFDTAWPLFLPPCWRFT
jgi:hypothetical protein